MSVADIDDKYVFWQGKRVPPHSLLKKTKTSILKKHQRKIRQMEEKARQSMLAAGVKESDIEDILSGRIFQNMTMAMDATPDSVEAVSWPTNIQNAYAFLSNTSQIDKVENLIGALKTFFDGMSGEYEKILKGYASAIIDDFTRGVKGTLSKQTKTGSVQQKIIDSILGRYNNDVFSVRDTLPGIKNLNAGMIKLYMLYKCLPEYGGKTTEVRHHGQEVGSGTKGSLSDGEILQGVVGKARSYVTGFNKTTVEYAIAYGFLGAHRPLINILPGMKTSVVGRQSKNMNIVYESDIQEMFRIVEAAEQTKTVSKPDVKLTFGANGVTGELNFSVKEYDSVTYSPNGMIQNAKGIKVQDSTPLLTLMAREASFSASDINYTVKVAAATNLNEANTGTDSSGNNLAVEWEYIKELITYSAGLSAVAGLAESTNGQNLFMVINRQVIPIRKIFDNIRKNKSNKALELGYGSKKGASASQGLEKATYEKINIENYKKQDKNNPTPWLDRSEQTYTDVLKQMYNTKIKISLNLTNLAVTAGHI